MNGEFLKRRLWQRPNLRALFFAVGTVFTLFIGCHKDSESGKPSTSASSNAENTINEEKSKLESAQNATGNKQLRIAAASDLKFALDELVPAFRKTHVTAEIVVTTGNSGQLYAQISNGAPFDLFLSADVEYARQVARSGAATADGEFLYARGYLVLWRLNDSPISMDPDRLNSLSNPEVKTIAVANPKTAPYGRAAIEALRSLEIYAAIEPKLVYADSVAHAAQMAESGAADVGFIAQSLARSKKVREQGVAVAIPSDLYQPIIQGGVILASAGDRKLAAEFRDFLRSGEGRSILKEFGFDEPGE